MKLAIMLIAPIYSPEPLVLHLWFNKAFIFLQQQRSQLLLVWFIHSSEPCILFVQVATAIPCLYIPIYFIPLFFQFVHGDTALRFAVRLLTFICVAVAEAMITGDFFPKTIYMPLFLTGGVLATIGEALLHSIALDSSNPIIYGCTAIFAFGAGLFLQAPFSMTQTIAEPHLVPAVTTFISCSQLSSITLTLAITNCIFVNRSVSRIAAVLPGAPIGDVQAAITGVDATFLRQLDAADLTRLL